MGNLKKVQEANGERLNKLRDYASDSRVKSKLAEIQALASVELSKRVPHLGLERE